MAFSMDELMSAVQSGQITMDQAQQYAANIWNAGQPPAGPVIGQAVSTSTPVARRPMSTRPSSYTQSLSGTENEATEGSLGLRTPTMGFNVSQPQAMDYQGALETQARQAQLIDPEYRAAHPEMWQTFARIDAERAKYAPEKAQQDALLEAARANPEMVQGLSSGQQRELAGIATERQAMEQPESIAWYKDMTAETAPTEIGGLPTTFREGKGLGYDTGAMAQALDMSPELVAYFSDPNAQMTEGLRTQLEEAGDAGAILNTLRWLPAHKDAPVDLSNELQLQNLLTGGTGGGANISVDPSGTTINDFLYNKPDESKWYNADRLVPLATMVGMGLVSGGAGAAMMAPAAAAVGGGLGGAALTGAGAGAMATMPSTFLNTAQALGADLDLGAAGSALAEGTKQGLVGSAIGAATAGAAEGLGGMFGGAEQPSGYVEMPTGGVMGGEEQNIFGSARPFTDPAGGVGSEWTLTPGVDYAGGLEALGDMYGGLDTSNFGLEMPEIGADSIFDSNQDFSMGSVMPPGEMNQMTSTLEFLGENPAVGAANMPADSGLGLQDVLGGAFSLYQPDVRNSFVSPYRNEMLGGRSGQGAGTGQQMGLQEMQSPAPDLFSQQMQMVKSAQTPYTQDLLSLAMEDPDILYDPRVKEMLQSQVMGMGETMKRFGLENPTMGLADEAVI